MERPRRDLRGRDSHVAGVLWPQNAGRSCWGFWAGEEGGSDFFKGPVGLREEAATGQRGKDEAMAVCSLGPWRERGGVVRDTAKAETRREK